MKMTKILSLVLALIMVVACFAGCPSPDPDDTNTTTSPDGEVVNPLAGTYKITMWVSELTDEATGKSVVQLTQEQIAKFMAANPGIIIDAEISGVSEADAASQVLTDVVSAPDIYCFAQDQLARLVQASALAAPSSAVADVLKSTNDSNSVSAASVAGTMYAYPMTSDNGYYLYYNKKVVSDPSSLEAIIADIEAYNAANGTNLQFRFALENAWYTASFFFATGCVSTWTTDSDGNFTSINDTFNSADGVAAMKGMMKLAQSSCYNSDADKYDDTAAWVNGIWNANTAQEYFGDNFGVCKLPTFTVDGETYQLGSYSGNKLMGIKPQTDATKAAVLSLLAQYLTNEQCQLDRYELLQWGPSNLVAQQNEEVKQNASLAALADQNNYAIPQGQIHGSWWDIAKVLGADAKTVKTDAEIEAALKNYQDSVDAIFEMTEEQKAAWSVIGAVNGTNWDTDLPMEKVADGQWCTVDYLEFTSESQFVFRRGGNWNYKIGLDGEVRWDGEVDIGNIVFATFELPAGKYKVQFTWDENPEHDATVELIAE